MDFWDVLGSMPRFPTDSLGAASGITGGDANPDCSIGAFAYPMSFGWPWLDRSLSRPLRLHLSVPSLAADSRRARTCLLRTASLLLEVGLRITKPFPFSPFTFVPDDEGKYIEVILDLREISTSGISIIHRRAQVLAAASDERCIRR
jgi:hypothetical protein